MITALGATGNVGSKVAAALLKQGQRVRVVGRDAAKLARMHPGAELRIGDIHDSNFLTEALRGSDAAFVMIPPNYAAPSFEDLYRRASESIAWALKNSGVKHVVSLSSFGAHLAEGTGPIKYLGPHEARLNQVEGLNIQHVRPAYFMENLLANADLIKTQSIMGAHIAGDVKFAMIATTDIADYVVKKLSAKDFTGHSVQELLGPQDYTMNEAAAIISEVVGKPVKYIAFDAPSTIQALKGFGFSTDSAELFVEMSEALNEGLLRPRRDPVSTTPTTLAQFARVFKN